MPWQNCGNDWAVSYDSATFSASLTKYKNAGANVYRQWIHFDGNKSLNLWNNDKFAPLSAKFLNDAIDNLKLAKA